MDERRADPPPQLPAGSPAPPPDGPGEPPPRAGWGPPEPRRTIDWRRFVKTPRAAVGAGLVAAFVLLWPFSGFSWIPLLVGFGALLVVRILRFDGLLRGWDIPLAGLVVVIGLMWSTSPWAWALAAGIGVLIAGLLQLPEWKVAVVGLAICVAAATGYGISSYRTDAQIRSDLSQSNDRERAMIGESRPDLVLPAMLKAIALDDADPLCRILRDEAERTVVGAVQAPNCDAAVTELHRRVPDPTYKAASLPQPVQIGTEWQVDACATGWAQAVGRQLGRITIFQTAPDVRRFAVSGFSPCP
ncbi:hypothetical protein ACQEVB_06615 [Pseudonocardia sp. CA-107938]|uniref:hypothetical protein n=1 Tax=Pseudonocardia sp. CA-107938 TaxID=3240021 RepID=UPI003D93A782